ncbi:MAG: hypothetical protein Fur0016_02400 [Anaerolineales bacterium]
MLIFAVLLASAAFTGAMVVFCYRRRRVIGASTLMWIMIALTWWSLAYAVQTLRPNLGWQTFWASAQYLSVATLPVLWLIFAIQYSRQDAAPSVRSLLWLWILPVITILMAWTNHWHGQVWSGLKVITWNDVSLLKMEYGPYFWIHAIYSYGNFFVGIVFFVRQSEREDRTYRAQASLTLLAAGLLMVGNILYVFNLLPLQGLDITPLTFSISAGLLALALFRYQMLDLMPIANEIILKNMGDGILVLDVRSRVIYTNPAFEFLAGLLPGLAIGQDIHRLLPDWPDIFQRCEQKKTAEIEVEISGVKRIVELLISPLMRKNAYEGSIYVIRDITERLDLENRLRLSLEIGKKERDDAYIFLVVDAHSGQVLDVNNEFVVETGFSREQVLGRTLLQVGLWDVGTRTHLARLLREQNRLVDIPITIISRTGQRHNWILSISAVLAGGKEIQMWVARSAA